MMMVKGYDSKIIDIETAFLYGDFEDGEQIFMNCPQGMDHKEDECLELLKTMYGLVQASRQYFKKFVKTLKNLGFQDGLVDPCLMVKKTEKGIVYIAIYVDDCLLIGDSAVMEETVKDIRASGFNLKEDGGLDDYLSCEVTIDGDKKKGWIHQPHLIKKIEKNFGSIVKKMPKYGSPGTPRGIIKKSDRTVVSIEEEAFYRSAVGQLLYLVKYSRPDIANAVRELSKALDGINEGAMKELKRVLKFVISTKDLALKIEPNCDGLEKENGWSMVAFSDSDYAKDPVTRASISGYVLYFLGVPISWRSKGQKSVTLSSTEAEYIAMSECAKEIKFVYQLLDFMGIKVKLPIIVNVDNIGAMFMANNVAISNRTKHVDIRAKYVTQMCVEGFLKVIFVKSEDNDSDLFTKNLSNELHMKHARKLVSEKG